MISVGVSLLDGCILIHQDIVAEFYGPSRWKELSKESGSKILPYGDGSCWKAFKPIASLIAELDGIPIASWLGLE
ncbi:hypothetical protein Tco_1248835 [Tanacetum coccineum]